MEYVIKYYYKLNIINNNEYKLVRIQNVLLCCVTKINHLLQNFLFVLLKFYFFYILLIVSYLHLENLRVAQAMKLL